jgi:hypothetical protein
MPYKVGLEVFLQGEFGSLVKGEFGSLPTIVVWCSSYKVSLVVFLQCVFGSLLTR